MNHNTLKTIILDRIKEIQEFDIVTRKYEMEENGNYILIGLRRAGKSFLLYKRILDYVASGVEWEQIIYVNFEDERLEGFTAKDFQDIVEVQAELSDKPGYFFLDEIQNIDGWEKFVRRLADSKKRVFVTGSNAKMLSREMESSLGGRLLSLTVSPYTFGEFLTAKNIPHTENDLLTTTTRGAIARAYEDYLHDGGLPESLLYKVRKTYIESVYKKTLLHDIISRNNIRNDHALSLLIKKIAETVMREVSYSSLHGAVKAVGTNISKDTLIQYIDDIEEAFLMFHLQNYITKFAERESNPKYYFADNGILNLFLIDKGTALLENQIAVALHQNYGDDLYFFKSKKTGIDVDFYLPEHGAVYQVCYSLSDSAIQREVDSIVDLCNDTRKKDNVRCVEKCYIITHSEKDTIEKDGVTIQVVPAAEFLLSLE